MRDIESVGHRQKDRLLSTEDDRREQLVFTHYSPRSTGLEWARTDQPIGPRKQRISASTRVLTDEQGSRKVEPVLAGKCSFLGFPTGEILLANDISGREVSLSGVCLGIVIGIEDDHPNESVVLEEIVVLWHLAGTVVDERAV
jgi:hypothetical protein